MTVEFIAVDRHLKLLVILRHGCIAQEYKVGVKKLRNKLFGQPAENATWTVQALLEQASFKRLWLAFMMRTVSCLKIRV